jgi:hypothetical protein
MKKKTLKKLVLAKETLRSLEESTLSKVVGGTYGTACYTEIFWSCRVCQEEPITYSCYAC